MGTCMSMPTASHLHMPCKNKKNESKKGLCVLILKNAIWWQDNEDILLANTRTTRVVKHARGLGRQWRQTCSLYSRDTAQYRKWYPDRKRSPKWTANDPRPQVIPIVDRKWSRKSGGMDFRYGCTLGSRGFSCAVSGFGLASVLRGSFVTYSFLLHKYRKIPKISPGAYIFQRPFLRNYFLRGLSTQGNLRFKID